MSCLAFFLCLLICCGAWRIHAHPAHDLFFKYSQSIQGPDRGWLWGLWGADSRVSIVDKSPPVTFVSRPASFGSDLESSLLGYVIPLDAFTRSCANDTSPSLSPTPIDTPFNLGCPPLCLDGPYKPDPSESWIALVQRGGCQFVEKTREAQRLGAKAMVVGGDNPEIYGNPDTLVNMYSPEDASDIKIPSTYIRYTDYIRLYSLISTSNTSHAGLRTLSLLLSPEHPAWEWYSPIITFIIILILPSLLTLVTLCIHRIRASRAAQRDRAPEDIVKNLPWRVWNGKKWEKEENIVEPQPTFAPGDSEVDPEADLEQGTSRKRAPSYHLPWYETQMKCPICLEEFVKGDRVRVLPCEHIFHVEEIDDWLIHRKKLCPICKADVTQDQPNYDPHHLPTSPVLASSPLTRTAPPTDRTPLLQHDTMPIHD